MYSVQERGAYVNIFSYLFPPLLGGVIALSTNWLAIKMLFRPHKAKYIFGIKLPFTPGLIPKERSRLTKKLAEAISTRLLTPEVLAAELSSPSTWPLPDMTIGQAMASVGIDIENAEPICKHLKIMSDKLLPNILNAASNITELNPELDAKLAELTYAIIDENLGSIAKIFISKEKIYASIKEGITGYLTDNEKTHAAIDSILSDETVSTVITEKLYSLNIRDRLSAFFAKEKHAIERVLSIIAKYVATHIPIQSMIENKIAAFDVAELEDIIITVAGRELRVIILLGGVLGFLIGLLAVFL